MKYINYMIYVLFTILIISNCHQTVPTEVGNLSPKMPVNIFPPDDTTCINIETTFRWQAEDPNTNDSLFFDLYLGEGDSNLILVSSDLAADSFYKNDLKYATTYYWKIVAKDQDGDTTSSPLWLFKTRPEFITAPNIPGNPEPSDGANSIAINSVVLSWKGGDPDLNYDVLLGESANLLNTVSKDQPDSTYSISLLRYDKKYFWKIISKGECGNKTEGPVWSFETLLGETIFNWSFETDNINESPSALMWTVWDSLTSTFVTDEVSWDNQGKSVCFTDSTIDGDSYMGASVTPKKVGMLQFHFLMTSQDDYFGIRMYSEFADSNHLGPQISLREGKLQYFDKGREWKAVKPVENDSWYFLQVVFDCDQQFYNIYLDEKLVAEKVTWTGTMVPKLNLFYFLTFENRKCNKAYIDDVKFFSDP